MFVDYRQTNWPEWLAIAEFSYNNKIQKSIKISPFYANYGLILEWDLNHDEM